MIITDDNLNQTIDINWNDDYDEKTIQLCVRMFLTENFKILHQVTKTMEHNQMLMIAYLL